MSIQLVMYRGDDRTFTFTLTAEDDPIDLTGASVVFTGRHSTDFDEETPALTLSSDDGDIVIADQTDGYLLGMLDLHIPAAATVDLESNITLLCDFEVTDAYGLVRTWPDATYNDSALIRLRIRGDATRP